MTGKLYCAAAIVLPFSVWLSRSGAERANYKGETYCAFVYGYMMNRTPALTTLTVRFLPLKPKT
jgi:hypothetical protein